MRALILLSLFAAASIGALPTSAAADCVQGVCYVADGYDYGSCDEGQLGQVVGAWYSSAGVGFVSVGGGNYCYHYGSYWGNGISVGATACDAAWNCYATGFYWSEYTSSGVTVCRSNVDVWVDGQYIPQPVPLCPLIGGPPQLPQVLP